MNFENNDYKKWEPPSIPENIVFGDMVDDKVYINESHINKAKSIFPILVKQVQAAFRQRLDKKVVISVCGGSGVGKSETAAILTYYFKQIGIGSYTLSGDNYPYRVPEFNDAERYQIFYNGAIKHLIENNLYEKTRSDCILQMNTMTDSVFEDNIKKHEWFCQAIDSGKDRLRSYLGTNIEIDFAMLSGIIASFKRAESEILLKRMGRKTSQLWFDVVDFSEVQVLIVEWTHGNSEHLVGVDIPILLSSTPQETLAHRIARNRDKGVDSKFTSIVLAIEQEMLIKQAYKAKIIAMKDGKLIDYETYCTVVGS
jgi:alpha-galactosidase